MTDTKCKTCKHFKKHKSRYSDELIFGSCHISPPVVVQVENETESYGKTMWPEVDGDDCCSKHE